MTLMMTGVPERIAREGWWLDDSPEPVQGRIRQWPWRRLLALLLLGDLLFWRQAGPGLSLAIFFLALGLAAARPQKPWPLLGLILGLLPLVERVQALSVGFGLLAVLLYVVHSAFAHETRGPALMRALGRFLARAPGMALGDGLAGARALARVARSGGVSGRSFRALALPVGLGLVFASLLAEANPVLQDWAARLWQGAAPADLIPRLLFWAGLSLAIWPVLSLASEAERLAPRPARFGPWVPRARLGVVTGLSVTASLLLFNAMFAVQTGLDLAYLWGGAELPAGMSHAEYAHRGAYPLVATALLAGAFALISRPFAAESVRVRALLLLWVAQNVALVASALYRLDLYVESYGLTYLRAHAAVWMGLVAAGLVLVGVQVARGLANGWLVTRAASLGAGVLYLCCFVNFAGLIADHNLTAAREGRLVQGLDAGYLCALGPDAWGAVVKNRVAGWVLDCNLGRDFPDWARLPVDKPEIVGWRDWSYRSWRVLQEGRRAYSGRG